MKEFTSKELENTLAQQQLYRKYRCSKTKIWAVLVIG